MKLLFDFITYSKTTRSLTEYGILPHAAGDLFAFEPGKNGLQSTSLNNIYNIGYVSVSVPKFNNKQEREVL